MLVQRVATVTRNLHGHWLGLALVVASFITTQNCCTVERLVEYVDSLPIKTVSPLLFIVADNTCNGDPENSACKTAGFPYGADGTGGIATGA